ncbi:uncharacterized protein NECHADRAFT_83168 [Fusarium vanettenii 77-13-4]|uniref:Uncharacterized protein n=1 Tax=Fusarium vanettenii (strain ATCC MYA-4622 / CBS 123669 / FGSC 9596 / NRRL 45880 / 77-13-4) TaxID=660122 RepID=C7ZBG1_FUSV7|nr:uncharacterized protein NECHADRAFT_83168 [Fusarium vanettenii 77-13-4]EEU38850.1 hypothetical protein NECHADRAFT_83168 [Fusarium vanettenii 77-13-4]
MRPGGPQFGSQPGAIPELDYSSPSDVDLTNILYIHNIPMVPANMRPELDTRIKSITSWVAWELTRIEDGVQDKIRDRDLPMDDSMASKLKRMSYRSKVLDYTRRVSRWLVENLNPVTHSSQVSEGEDKINLAVAHSILEAFGTPSSPQVLNVLKATTQPHMFCVIDYDHDTIRETITATIKTFFFNVTVTESQDPSSHPARGNFSHRNNAFAPPEAKFYKARVEYTHTEANFEFRLWSENAPEEATRYALGKQVLAQRQLRLLKE